MWGVCVCVCVCEVCVCVRCACAERVCCITKMCLVGTEEEGEEGGEERTLFTSPFLPPLLVISPKLNNLFQCRMCSS